MIRRTNCGTATLGFNGGVDGHDAAEEVFDSDVATTEFGQHGSDAFLGRIFFERFENVGVSGGISAKDFAEERDEKFQVSKVGGAPGGEIGFAEIEDQKFAPGFEDAKHFDEAGAEVGKVAEAVGDGDDIEGIWFQRKVEGVGLKKS